MSKAQQESGAPQSLHPRAALPVLVEIARDLTASLAAEDRYDRLLDAVHRLVPYDAACLLRLDGEELVPLAARGLSEGALVQRFQRREHPRLAAILASSEPVLFPLDSTLPDPFDGWIEGDAHALEKVHACLGCRLTDGEQIVGALTADALEPHVFDDLDPGLLAMLAALAGAAIRTTSLVDRLERLAERRNEVARDLQRTVVLSSGGDILGTSPPLRRLLKDLALVARSDLPVLILGETGTGKELVAHRLHADSTRRDEPFIQVNCAALPEAIAESELFGHLAGAFTGATRDRAGKFEIADGGTLFLDEVGELPLLLQPKLLRALQQGEIQRVGSDKAHRVDVRVVAATNRDLAAEVERGRFRADLYHRLAVYPLRVPPLRERREDIPLLAASFLDQGRRRLGLGPLRLTDEARARLMAEEWPGNVRELENVISRAVLRAASASRGVRGEEGEATPLRIGPEHLDLVERSSARGMGRAGGGSTDPDDAGTEGLRVPSDAHHEGMPTALPDFAPDSGAFPGGEGREPLPLSEQVRAFQRRRIEEAVARHDGNWAAAARELGMHRANLHHLAQRLGLRPR